jgi:hypothetical protein
MTESLNYMELNNMATLVHYRYSYRSFANNITTSGVLLPASLTNDSIANVTAYNASVLLVEWY